MHQISEEQLDNLASNGFVSHSNFAFALLGVCATMGAVLATAPEGTTPSALAVIVAMTFASGVLAVAFGLLAWKDHRKRQQTLQALKKRRG